MTDTNKTSEDQGPSAPVSEEQIKDLIKELLNKGQLDRELAINFGVTRRGY